MAGSIVVSSRTLVSMGKAPTPQQKFEKVVLTWTGDASDGSTPATSIDLTGRLVKAVTIPTIAKEVVTVQVGPDVSGSLNSKYFLISSPTTNYYVWFNINSAGVDPAVATRTGVAITGATNVTAATLATSIKTALDALGGTPFVTVRATALLTITASANGVCVAPADGVAPTGFAITEVTHGTAPTDNYNVKIYDADDTTNSLDVLAGTLASRDTITPEQVYPLITSSNVSPLLGPTHQVQVTSNTAKGATGQIILYLTDRPL